MTKVSGYLRTCGLVFRDRADLARVAEWSANVERNQSDPMPLYHVAELCLARGYPDLWRSGIGLALARRHDTYQATFHRAWAKLRLGDWSGWNDYEARLFRPGTVTIRSMYARHLCWTARPWEPGENLSNATLLMIEEGGFGDSLQSLCFVPALVTSARRVILMVKPELVSFVAHNFGHVADVVASGADLGGRFDRYVWSSSLPSLVGALPAFEPLRAPNPFPRMVAASPRLRLGLCWAAEHDRGKRTVPRSIRDFRIFESFLILPGIEWYNLQVGDRATDADRYPRVRSPHPPLRTFADTANLISSLDGVVTVDTAVCHLAGRLNIPTFVILSHAPDWKWGLGDTTPWYPSIRLVRQREPGDWASAVTAVARRLRSVTRRRALSI